MSSAAFGATGYADVTVHVVLSPAWTTEWMSEAGRIKLREYGIAPPRAQRFDVKSIDSRGRMPAMQLVTHPRGRAFRFDAVPGGAPVRRMRRDVPALQGALSGLTVSPVAEAAAGHRRATIHPLRVKAVEPLTDEAVVIEFEVPPELED